MRIPDAISLDAELRWIPFFKLEELRLLMFLLVLAGTLYVPEANFVDEW